MTRNARQTRAPARPLPPLPHPAWRHDEAPRRETPPLKAAEFWERLGL